MKEFIENKKIDKLLLDLDSKDEALKIIKSFHDIIKLSESDYIDREGYERQKGESNQKFGYKSYVHYSPSTLLHEYSHAIDSIMGNEPSRILENAFGMQSNSAIEINEEYFSC